MSTEGNEAKTESSSKDEVLVDRLRKKCLTRGFSGVKCFSTAFRQFDKDFSRQINFTEFQKGLQRYDVSMNETEQKSLFERFDKDSSGCIDFQEFYHNLTPPLDGKRLEVVQHVFHHLDHSGDGFIQASEIMALFSEKAKRHPRYESGEWGEEEVVANLLSAFEQPGSKDGVVSEQEFIDYYSAVSTCVQDDAYFEASLKSCWGVE